MKNFTVEETNLMCCFNTSSRKRLIDDMIILVVFSVLTNFRELLTAPLLIVVVAFMA